MLYLRLLWSLWGVKVVGAISPGSSSTLKLAALEGGGLVRAAGSLLRYRGSGAYATVDGRAMHLSEAPKWPRTALFPLVGPGAKPGSQVAKSD